MYYFHCCFCLTFVLCCTEPVKPVHTEPQRGSSAPLKHVRAEETHWYTRMKKMHRITVKYETPIPLQRQWFIQSMLAGDRPKAQLHTEQGNLNKGQDLQGTSTCTAATQYLAPCSSSSRRGGLGRFIKSKHNYQKQMWFWNICAHVASIAEQCIAPMGLLASLMQLEAWITAISATQT